MKKLITNNCVFNLKSTDDIRRKRQILYKEFFYNTENIYKEINDRNEFDEFIKPIVLDFIKVFKIFTINKHKIKSAFLCVYVAFNGNDDCTGFNYYQVSYADDEKIVEETRLSKEVNWLKNCKYFRIRVDFLAMVH